MAEDSQIVLVSIFSTLLAALVVLVAVVAVSGGLAVNLVRSYVLPLVISAFTLAVFWGVLVARSKGMLPWLAPDEKQKQQQQQEEAAA